MPPRHLVLGRLGEDAAAAFLRKKGYKVRDRNWRGTRGELDLICEKDGEIVFVEVKTRTPGPMNKPYQGLTANKQSVLMRTVSEYLSRGDLWDRPCRLDLVGVEIENDDSPVIEHIENACSLTPQGGNWQPW
ncbi:YraN family protein [Desulfovibrio ferrophilus]|uniref:UPF0102 protein DFE_2134 n=1 Tax=Desulfovibrio ferrophilus TaxID=241368 RepID=A0A2Z6B0A3_9BACT|nr:YraN family protein [Desulfovibrio ferrophilus]BBD08860.1 UPF0102 protein Desal_0201 [Desulfovibrio ferrophilus]